MMLVIGLGIGFLAGTVAGAVGLVLAMWSDWPPPRRKR